jgi:1,4-alpha-glucan branching enzyme
VSAALHASVVEEIVAGRHADPCAVLGPMDDRLIGQGQHRKLYERVGAHAIEHEGAAGVHFAVWAPNARRVSVVGDFKAWDGCWREILNTDALAYGGSGKGNAGAVVARPAPSHGCPCSATLTLAPLATLWLVYDSGS